MDDNTLFSGLWKLVLKERKTLVVILLIAGVAGVVFSSPAFMKPRFESVAVVYPMNIAPLSDESKTEQMLELFEMNRIKDTVINRFELYERDDLVPGEPEYRHWVDLLYQQRVSISPTKNESVRISCQDEDPEVAKQMVETIIDEFNNGVRELFNEQNRDYLKLKKEQLRYLKQTKDSLSVRLRGLIKESGVVNVYGEAERYAEGYMAMLEENASDSRLEKVQERVQKLGEFGSEINFLNANIGRLGNLHAELAKEITKHESRLYGRLEYAKVVKHPVAADKKIYPVRWLVLLISLIVGGLIGLTFIVIREYLVRGSIS